MAAEMQSDAIATWNEIKARRGQQRGQLRALHISELIKEGEEERNARMALPLTHLDHWNGFKIDRENNTLDVYWGGYEYWIDLARIQRPIHVLEWIHHWAEKGWKGMTPEKIGRLIESVCHFKEWDLYGGGGPVSRETSADEERRKLTPQLRFSVLKRDGHRCRSCGSGPENGAFLQIDHIVPISKGGTTEITNLQTLCAVCNFGKLHR